MAISEATALGLIMSWNPEPSAGLGGRLPPNQSIRAHRSPLGARHREMLFLAPRCLWRRVNLR